MGADRFQQMQQQMVRRLGPEQGPRIAAAMKEEYEALCASCTDQPKAMGGHCRRNIFPVVACFRALIAQGTDRSQAALIAEDAFLELMEAPAAAIRRMMKIPGLFHLMPWLWRVMMPRLFSEGAGFRFRCHPSGFQRVRFDMLECPYQQVCQKLNCEELAPTFCATDDLCYGHMHPRLLWNRTKTLARGGDFCDFDLYVSKK